MGNAVILAEPKARFLRRWMESYRTFRSTGRDDFWNEHSVQIPHRLAAQHPVEVEVLSHQAFFWPLWFEAHLRRVFDSTDPVLTDETYANHLWETVAWEFLKDLTPGIVRGRDTNFHRWIEPYLAGLPDDFGVP